MQYRLMIKLLIAQLIAIMVGITFYPTNLFADTATATQQVRIIIPKIALIDVDNTHAPLQINFNPMTDAGDNFSTVEVTGHYDVTSNIRRLRLYGKTDTNLESNYNLKLEVMEVPSAGYQTLTTTSQWVSNQNRQAQKDQPLFYRVSPAFSNKTIPYGDIDVTITYTLVEP